VQRSKFEAFAVSGDGRSSSLPAAGSRSGVRGSEKICNRASLLLKMVAQNLRGGGIEYSYRCIKRAANSRYLTV